MNTDNLFESAQIILKGLKSLHVITEGEQRIFSDLILRFDQLKDIAILRKYNTLLFRLIDQLQVQEYKSHQFIYEDGQHRGMKYFLVGGEAVYTRQNQQLNEVSSKQVFYKKLEEKSQINASENKKRAFQLIQDMKNNKTKPIRQLRLGELFGSREDYNDHLVFKSRRLEQEYINLQEQLDFNQFLSVQALTDCIVLTISQQSYDALFKTYNQRLEHLISVLSTNLMNINIDDSEKYQTEYFAHFYDDNIYQQKEILIQQGMPTDYLYFVRSGHVQIQKSMTELYRYGPDQYLLQKNFLNSKCYEHNVQVIEPETVVTRIQRYFIYLLLKIKSLNSKPNSNSSKQTITSLYQCSNTGSKQSLSTPQTQASLSSQLSFIRQSHTFLDCSSLFSSSQRESQREIITPTQLQPHHLLSNTLHAPQTHSIIQAQNNCYTSQNTTIQLGNQASKRLNQNNQTFSSGFFNSHLSHNISTVDNQENHSAAQGCLSSTAKRRIIIPTKNKIFQNFQRSISANLRKREENKQAQESFEQQKLNKQILTECEFLKSSIQGSEKIEVTVNNQSQNQITASSLVKQPKSKGLKRMQTVSFSTNLNTEETPENNANLNISSFCQSEKTNSFKIQSTRSSISQKEEIPTQGSTRNSSKKSTALFLKPKILNLQEIFPDSSIEANTPPFPSLTQSANLNDHPNILHHSKFFNSSSSIFSQNSKLAKNPSTPNLNLKRIPTEQIKDLDIGKPVLSSRVFTPTLGNSNYFISQNKYGKHRSIYNQSNSNSSNNSNSSLPRKNSSQIKSQPLKRSNFVQSLFDNSHNHSNNMN